MMNVAITLLVSVMFSNMSNINTTCNYQTPILCSVSTNIGQIKETDLTNIDTACKEKDYILNQSEIDLISRVVMAEAEGEPLEGKIYVIDTIFNRIDSDKFPNTVHDVIYQKNQFTSIWNGRFDRCEKNEQLDEIIIKEYYNRTNNEIVFFTAGEYGQYGIPAFKVGNHYFSIY